MFFGYCVIYYIYQVLLRHCSSNTTHRESFKRDVIIKDQTHSMKCSSKYRFLWKLFPAGKKICSFAIFTWMDGKEIFYFIFTFQKINNLTQITNSSHRMHSLRKHNMFMVSAAKNQNFILDLLILCQQEGGE